MSLQKLLKQQIEKLQKQQIKTLVEVQQLKMLKVVVSEAGACFWCGMHACMHACMYA